MKNLVILCLMSLSLFSKDVYWLGLCWEHRVEVEMSKPIEQYTIWELMVTEFKEHGLNLKFISGKKLEENFKTYLKIFRCPETAYVVMEEIQLNPQYMKYYYFLTPVTKRVLIPWEPPTVHSFVYSNIVLSKYAKIFTWNNDLLDDKRFFKIYHPKKRPMRTQRPCFKDKKLSCMVFANKTSTYPLELYTLRKKVIDFFSNKSSKFDLYGVNWPSNTANYKGKVQDKIATIKNYKFCFSMENTRDVSGYMTEKIWDAFAAGVIPIYWGDSTVQNEIPSKCYIDMRKYSSLEELLAYMESISQEEYESRISAIKDFLKSECAQKYTHEFYRKSLAKYLSL
jgi:alpha(1,3/1,4) fucosyltransferase